MSQRHELSLGWGDVTRIKGLLVVTLLAKDGSGAQVCLLYDNAIFSLSATRNLQDKKEGTVQTA